MSELAEPIGGPFDLEHAGRLLDPAPVALETGVQRLPSGQLHVAARTDMPGCSGRMFEWWFRFAPDTRQYAWWHPLDHVSSRWVETSALTHVGSTHIVEERLGEGTEIHALRIHFVDPAELFGAEAVEDAKAAGHVSAIVAAQLGQGAEPLRDERGRPNMGADGAHRARHGRRSCRGDDQPGRGRTNHQPTMRPTTASACCSDPSVERRWTYSRSASLTARPSANNPPKNAG